MPRTLSSVGLAFVTWFTGLAFLIVAVAAPGTTESPDGSGPGSQPHWNQELDLS